MIFSRRKKPSRKSPASHRFAYFPGCSMHSTAKEYAESLESVCEALDLELVEIPDWNCCGATSAHSLDHKLSIALPARNLALAEQMGLDIAVPCAACYNRLAVANENLKNQPELREEINESLPQKFRGNIKVRPLIEVIVNEVGLSKIAEAVKEPLSSLKVACYYGCLLVRPPKILGFDDAEDPQSLDRLVKTLGAETVEWPHKTECCGASFSLTRRDIVYKLTGDVLKMAKRAGADCIVTACPLCMSNLDMRQSDIEKMTGEKFDLPVFFFTELMGWAMHLDNLEGCLERHFVNPKPLVQKITLNHIAAEREAAAAAK